MRAQLPALVLLLGCPGNDGTDSGAGDTSNRDTADGDTDTDTDADADTDTGDSGTPALERVEGSFTASEAGTAVEGNNTANARFGSRVVARGTALLVGAEGEGAVYIFVSGVRRARFAYSGGPAGDSLCAAGDLDGDALDDFVVADRDVHGAGLAWVLPLTGADGTDFDAAPATIGSATPGDELGSALACGRGQLAVGARGADGVAGEDVGAVWVYAAPLAGQLDRTAAAAVVEGEAAGDYAGRAVAFGDLDGDGVDDLAVGAYRNSEGARYAGAAYVLDVATMSLADATSKVTGTTEGDAVGRTVTVARDLDGDGLPDLVVGATGHDELRGAAYVFTTVPPGTSSVAAASASVHGAEPDDSGGVAIAGADLDGDEVGDLAFGAPGERESVEEDPPPGWVGVLFGPLSGTYAADSFPLRVTGDQDGDAMGIALTTVVDPADGPGGSVAAAAYRAPSGDQDDAGKVYVIPVTLP